MKTYLVTGAAGFIGFFLSKALLDKGEQVIGLDNLNDYYEVSYFSYNLETKYRYYFTPFPGMQSTSPRNISTVLLS